MKIHRYTAILIGVVIIVVIGIGIATFSLAKTQNPITEQKVKTVHFSISYDDVMAASDISYGGADKGIDLITFPAGVEVTSAFLDVREPFSSSVIAGVELHEAGNGPISIVNGDLLQPGIQRSFLNGSAIVSTTLAETLTLRLSNPTEPLTVGTADIYVTYISH